VLVEFFQGDTSGAKVAFSLGDSSATTRSQVTLEIATNFRTVRLNTFGNDVIYQPWSVSGTSARVLLMITYDGNRALRFRSISRLSNGQLVVNALNSTLNGVLNTGNTVPLHLMGGGTYAYQPMNTALYYFAMFGGRVLTDAEMDRMYMERYQNIEPAYVFPYAALAAAAQQPIAGALAWTEANDAAALAAIAANRTAVQWTEAGDSSVLRGEVSDARPEEPAAQVISAALAWAEGGDSALLSISARNRIALAWTEQGDTWRVGATAATPPVVALSVRFDVLPRDFRTPITRFSN
jgi:hypothetical protein